jgi:hypothetical protein
MEYLREESKVSELIGIKGYHEKRTRLLPEQCGCLLQAFNRAYKRFNRYSSTVEQALKARIRKRFRINAHYPYSMRGYFASLSFHAAPGANREVTLNDSGALTSRLAQELRTNFHPSL